MRDCIVQYLLAGRQEALPELGRQGFLLDGSCIDLPHAPELVETYPPSALGKNDPFLLT